MWPFIIIIIIIIIILVTQEHLSRAFRSHCGPSTVTNGAPN